MSNELITINELRDLLAKLGLKLEKGSRIANPCLDGEFILTDDGFWVDFIYQVESGIMVSVAATYPNSYHVCVTSGILEIKINGNTYLITIKKKGIIFIRVCSALDYAPEKAGVSMGAYHEKE